MYTMPPKVYMLPYTYTTLAASIYTTLHVCYPRYYPAHILRYRLYTALQARNLAGPVSGEGAHQVLGHHLRLTLLEYVPYTYILVYVTYTYSSSVRNIDLQFWYI